MLTRVLHRADLFESRCASTCGRMPTNFGSGGRKNTDK